MLTLNEISQNRNYGITLTKANVLACLKDLQESGMCPASPRLITSSITGTKFLPKRYGSRMEKIIAKLLENKLIKRSQRKERIVDPDTLQEVELVTYGYSPVVTKSKSKSTGDTSLITNQVTTSSTESPAAGLSIILPKKKGTRSKRQ